MAPGVTDAEALSERGPFGVGRLRREIIDEDREDRRIGLTAFYPALAESRTTDDAAPDDSGAPYPIVLGDWKIGEVVGVHLASHGFVFLMVSEPEKVRRAMISMCLSI